MRLWDERYGQHGMSRIRRIHFIGIGGIGISAVARMMFHDGKIVTGQDMQEGEVVKELRKVGAQITIGQSYENIPKDLTYRSRLKELWITSQINLKNLVYNLLNLQSLINFQL